MFDVVGQDDCRELDISLIIDMIPGSFDVACYDNVPTSSTIFKLRH